MRGRIVSLLSHDSVASTVSKPTVDELKSRNCVRHAALHATPNSSNYKDAVVLAVIIVSDK